MIGQLWLCETCGAADDTPHASDCPNRPTLRVALLDMDGTVLDTVELTDREYTEEVKARPLGVLASMTYRIG